jgi:transcriptional regulator with XRE-family HTH domain
MSRNMKNILAVIAIMEKFPHQGDLAREIGLGESVLSRIINGRQLPTEEQAEKIAKVLQVPVKELFTATR